MNDCIYDFILACTKTDCQGCSRYCSINSEHGEKIYNAYQEDVEEALKPVHAQWQAFFNGEGDLD